MSIHVCESVYRGNAEFHLRYPGMTEQEAQNLADSINGGCVPVRSSPPKFQRGDLVRKKSGSQWEGRVVGAYSTELTPEGYAVESSTHKGSVQIYPASALEPVPTE